MYPAQHHTQLKRRKLLFVPRAWSHNVLFLSVEQNEERRDFILLKIIYPTTSAWRWVSVFCQFITSNRFLDFVMTSWPNHWCVLDCGFWTRSSVLKSDDKCKFSSMSSLLLFKILIFCTLLSWSATAHIFFSNLSAVWNPKSFNLIG